jgi:PAS domain S-box-containing protein
MSDEERTESERRYRQLIRTSPAPINLFDATGTVIWGNDAVVDLLGLESRDRLVGRSIFEFVAPEDRYTAERELVEVVESKTPVGPTEMRLRRADGDTRDVRISTAPGRYRGEDIGQAVVIDVTELREVQAELERERRFVEEAVDTLQDVFYVIDPGGELERWNDALVDVSGYTESEVREMEVEEFFVEEHVERVSESIAVAFAAGEDVLEATVVTKHGAEIPYEFRKRRLLEDGEVVGLVGIGRDVSARKMRDQHLRTVDHLLRHTLRNQLNVIRGTAETLREAGATDAEQLDRIDDAADRLLAIFENHRHVVDVLTGRETTDPVDVVPMVESVVRDCREAYPSAVIDVDAPETARASAAPGLETAVGELVENGVEHNDKPEPRVDVAVEATGSTVRVRIADDGPTIPEMEHRFLTLDAPTEPTTHPTGLSLWFAHLVVKRSGGTLRFAENDPEGTVVTVELPAAQAPWVE